MFRNFFYKLFLKTKEVIGMALSMTPSFTLLKKPAGTTFFFGYGSLMYPNGINRRGMKKRYESADLKAAFLKDFSRSFNARSWNGMLYYGVVRSVGSSINGTVFEVLDDHDYTRLLISEGAHPAFGKACVYNCLEVTDKVSGVSLPTDAKVYIVVPASPTDIGYLPTYYVREVWEGIQFWGKSFLDEFLRTGGLKYDESIFELQRKFAEKTAEFLKTRGSNKKNVRKGMRKATVKGRSQL